MVMGLQIPNVDKYPILLITFADKKTDRSSLIRSTQEEELAKSY